MSQTVTFVFNPAEKPKQQLIAEFVIRQKEFDNVFEVIKDADYTTAPQHFLIVGQRGMGKTTLLLRLKYAIEDDPPLSTRLIPVRFSEEQYNITTLDRLWEETAQILELKNAAYKGLYQKMLAHENEKDYESIAMEMLSDALKANKHRTILFIDNIGKLFSKFGDQSNHRFRKILMTSPYIQLIAGTSEVLEHTFKYDKPFFEFFREIKLQPITQEQTIDLLRTLGIGYGQSDRINEIIRDTPERIDALRRITGGVPRTIALLFEIFIDETDGSAFEDMQQLLDRVNPLYQERMDILKQQQQQIIDALARAWDPIDAGDILEKSKLYREGVKSNQISAQLKQLTDNQLIEQSGDGRKKHYNIRERFFNIWYLMRYGRKQNKEDVKWLVKFFETWYTMKDILDMTVHQRRCMKDGNYSIHAAYHKAKALSMIEMEPKFKNEYLAESSEFLMRMGEIEKADEIKGLVAEPNQYEYSIKGIQASLQKDLKLAEKYLIKAAIASEPHGYYNLGYFYHMFLKDYEKAELNYHIALDKGDIYAWNNLAVIYKDKGDLDMAKEYWLSSAKQGDVNGMRNLGIIYANEIKDFSLAEHYYKMAVERGDVHSMFNLGLIYDERKDYEKAEQYYLIAIQKDDVGSMHNLGLLYKYEKEDLSNAEKFLLMSAEKGNVDSIFELATLYEDKLNNLDKAEHFYSIGAEKGDLHAMNNLALLYQYKRNDIEKAEFYFSMAFEKGSVFAAGNLTILFLKESDIVKAMHYAESMFRYESIYNTNYKEVIETIHAFAVKKQYHFLMNQFKKEDNLLLRHAKPFYYAIAYFLRDEMPGEYEKAGAELKETVDEIIAKIQKGQAEEGKEKQIG